ncbi:MAG: patatin-like phospholipase family protein [Bacteroidia bacterium]
MEYKFKNLVFEGGGVKGIAYGGALKILDSRKIISGIVRVAGTSAGAINAALLAFGYSFEDVSKVIAETKFSSFQDKTWFLPTNINRFLFRYGYYKGDSFLGWLGDKIKEKTNNADFTFGELKERAGKDGYKELYVIATNLSQQRAEVISHETYPDLPIREAVRMSMGIPFFFKVARKSNDVMVDGGVSWNYPINLFDYKKYLVNPLNVEDVGRDGANSKKYATDEDYIFNYETLGMRLDSTTVIEYAKHNWALPPSEIKNLMGHTTALLGFMMEIANSSHLHSNDWNRTIAIDTLGIKTTQFNLTDAEIKSLLDSGEECTRKYFEWRDTDALWGKLPQ